MATGFTEDEVQAAVDQFLLRQLTVSPLRTGARDIRALRNAVYDLITTALLLRPDSFFYVVWQATNKLKGLVTQQISALDLIEDYGPGVSRPSKKINSTSELTNARAALLEVNSGLNSRAVGVRGSIGPAVARFRRSITRFLNDEITKNVVVSGEVTETADSLRKKVRSTWAEATARHAEIKLLSENTVGALSALSGVSLPQSAIQSITEKIQTRLEELETILAGTQGVQESKQAMLDLLTMRTLLAKSASFRSPALHLAPLTGDSGQLAFLDSDGEEALAAGTVSGPFNYDPGATLSLSINSAFSTPVIALPRHSRAELRSQAMPVWADPPVTAIIEITLNITGSAGPYTTAGPYGGGPAAAAAFDAALVGVQVTWDGVTNQLVFQSEDETDTSRLRFLTTTVNHADFVAWAFNGGLLEARSIPVSAAEVIVAISDATPLVDATVVEEFFGSFNGTREATPLDVVWNKKDQGTNLNVDTTNVVTSPTKNFQRLGVRAGMALEITAPPANVGQFVITGVAGGQLTLDAPVPGPLGVATYFIGPDYRVVPDGARVQMTSRSIGDNTAFYRVAVGGGLVARLQLDRNIPFADATLIGSVFQQTLELRARGTTTTSGIGVTAVNPLGFPVSAETPPDLSTMELVGAGDLLVRGVRAGDRVLLTSPGSASYLRYVSGVTTNRITFTEPVPYEPGNWAYRIQSFRVYQYTVLVDGDGGATPYVNEFLLSQYVAAFAELDTFIGRLARGGKYTGQIQTAVQQYRSDLSDLLEALQLYSVPSERTIDNAIKTMREQGLDRATDLFLALDIEEFFGMDPEGVSYSTWLSHEASRVVRNVAPVSKLAKGPLIRPAWRPLSFQLNPLDLRGPDDGQ